MINPKDIGPAACKRCHYLEPRTLSLTRSCLPPVERAWHYSIGWYWRDQDPAVLNETGHCPYFHPSWVERLVMWVFKMIRRRKQND